MNCVQEQLTRQHGKNSSDVNAKFYFFQIVKIASRRTIASLNERYKHL